MVHLAEELAAIECKNITLHAEDTVFTISVCLCGFPCIGGVKGVTPGEAHIECRPLTNSSTLT